MKSRRVVPKGDVMSSRPARALWIEISGTMQVPSVISVEAREGLVD